MIGHRACSWPLVGSSKVYFTVFYSLFFLLFHFIFFSSLRFSFLWNICNPHRRAMMDSQWTIPLILSLSPPSPSFSYLFQVLLHDSTSRKHAFLLSLFVTRSTLLHFTASQLSLPPYHHPHQFISPSSRWCLCDGCHSYLRPLCPAF